MKGKNIDNLAEICQNNSGNIDTCAKKPTFFGSAVLEQKHKQ